MTYTREQLEAMPDDELDAAVAEVVMGWIAKGDPDNGLQVWLDRAGYPVKDGVKFTPSTHWPDCGEVIGRLVEMGFNIVLWPGSNHSQPEAIIGHTMIQGDFVARNDVLARALSIVAVLAMQGESK